MIEANLKRLVKKSKVVIEALLSGLSSTIQVENTEGLILIGNSDSQLAEKYPNKYPILLNAEIIGWVSGEAEAAPVAQLISHLAEREMEIKTLAQDALDKYREINLLYNLSEKLNASLDVRVVAQTVLSEVRKLIPATHASIALLNLSGEIAPSSIFSSAESSLTVELLKVYQVITRIALQTGKGEILNDVATDARYGSNLRPFSSLIYVPLKTEKGITGVLHVGSYPSVHYTAQHLKLLNTVASQAAQVLENARTYQQQLQAAKAREEKLQRQLQELRVEVDEVKRSRQVAEITETEYFQQLQQRVGQLRKRRE